MRRLPSLPLFYFLATFLCLVLLTIPSPVLQDSPPIPSKFRPQDLDHVMRSLPSARNLLGRFDDLIDFHGSSRLLSCFFMIPA